MSLMYGLSESELFNQYGLLKTDTDCDIFLIKPQLSNILLQYSVRFKCENENTMQKETRKLLLKEISY